VAAAAQLPDEPHGDPDRVAAIGDLMADPPAPLHAQVYEVLSLELRCSHDTRQALPWRHHHQHTLCPAVMIRRRDSRPYVLDLRS